MGDLQLPEDWRHSAVSAVQEILTNWLKRIKF